jgi:hypothetical protein
MPTYTFKDIESDETFDELMSYSEKVEFLEANPQIKPVLNSVNIVAGVGLDSRIKNDEGWNENLQRIAEAHPSSQLANRYVSKTAKEAKTENAVAKWRKERQQ